MNGIENISSWLTVTVSLLLVVGGSMTLIGALGLLRLPSFYQRIHGPAIIVTLGAGGVLLASMLYFTALQARLAMHEVIIVAFIFMTTPVVSMLLMRAAIYRDLRAGKPDQGKDAKDVYGPFPK
jgi:multicomponent K+:H+ antiporter subunit G